MSYSRILLLRQKRNSFKLHIDDYSNASKVLLDAIETIKSLEIVGKHDKVLLKTLLEAKKDILLFDDKNYYFQLFF